MSFPRRQWAGCLARKRDRQEDAFATATKDALLPHGRHHLHGNRHRHLKGPQRRVRRVKLNPEIQTGAVG